MTDYFEEVGNSFKLLFRNPGVFVTLLVGLGIGLVQLLLLAFFGVIIYFVSGGTFLGTAAFVLIGLFGLIFIIISFILGGYLKALTIGFLKEVAVKGRAPVDRMFYYGKTYWKDFLAYQLLLFFVYVFLPGLLLALFIGLTMLTDGGLRVVFLVLSALLGIVFVLYMIFLSLAQFFSEVMIVAHDISGMEAISRGFKYLFKKPANVFATVGVLILLAFGLAIVLIPLTLLEMIPIMVFILLPIRLVIQAVYSLLTQLYIARVYCVENNVKN